MFKNIFVLLYCFVLTSCFEQNKDEFRYNPYILKVKATSESIIEDSIFKISYHITNLDTINYYLPGSMFWFSGNSDTFFGMALDPGKIHAIHNINYYPIQSKLKALFELNYSYDFNMLPFFYKIKPKNQLNISLDIIHLIQATNRIGSSFGSEYNYSIISLISLIDENNFLNMIETMYIILHRSF